MAIIRISGIDEMIAALDKGSREFSDVMVEALAGDGGQAILSAARMRINSRTGALAGSLRIKREGRTVEVGYDEATNPMAYVGTIVESGAAAHVIRPKRSRGKRGALRFNGGEFRRANHPGMRGQKIMGGALRTARWEVETAIIEEFERRGVAQP